MSDKIGGFPKNKIQDAMKHLDSAPTSVADDPLNAVESLLSLALKWSNKFSSIAVDNLVFVISERAAEIGKNKSFQHDGFILSEASPPYEEGCFLVGSSMTSAWTISNDFKKLKDLHSILITHELQKQMTVVMQPQSQEVLIFCLGLDDPTKIIKFSLTDFKTVDEIHTVSGMDIVYSSMEDFHNSHTITGANDHYWEDRKKFITVPNLEKKIQRDLSIYLGAAVKHYKGKIICEPQVDTGRLDINVLFKECPSNQDTLIELKALREKSPNGKKAKKDHIDDGIEQAESYKQDLTAAHGILAVYDACKTDQTEIFKSAEEELTKRGLRLGWYRMYSDVKKGRRARNIILRPRKDD